MGALSLRLAQAVRRHFHGASCQFLDIVLGNVRVTFYTLTL